MWGDFGDNNSQYENYEQLKAVNDLKTGISAFYYAFIPLDKGLNSKQKRAMLFKLLKGKIKEMESNEEPLDINFDYEWVEGEK
jgi:hypothetical protein